MKTCYYYQTFVGLNNILNNKIYTDVIIISSLHFNKINTNTEIYLNDNKPNDKIFEKLWQETELCNKNGIKIMLMMGGAGGAYGPFFSDYNNCYLQLKNLIKSKPWISGIDLDIEEIVDINNIKKLIEDIKKDFSNNFTITMAPLASSLENDISGMGGFSYKELCKTHGKYISWFNTQCYNGTFNYDTFNNIIKNKYPSNKIVMGMMSGDYNENTFKNALNEVNKIKIKYNDMGGVFDWEYLNAPPDPYNPSVWAEKFKQIDSKINYYLVQEEESLSLLHKHVEINDLSPRNFKYIYSEMINLGYSFIKLTESQKKNLLIELRLLIKNKYPLSPIENEKINNYLINDNSLTRSSSFEDLLNTWEIIEDSDED
jgi:alkaline phosphatase D